MTASYESGEIVWGKMKGFPEWPGRIIVESEMPAVDPKKVKAGLYPIRFFGSGDYGWLKESELKPFGCPDGVRLATSKRVLKPALADARAWFESDLDRYASDLKLLDEWLSDTAYGSIDGKASMEAEDDGRSHSSKASSIKQEDKEATPPSESSLTAAAPAKTAGTASKRKRGAAAIEEAESKTPGPPPAKNVKVDKKSTTPAPPNSTDKSTSMNGTLEPMSHRMTTPGKKVIPKTSHLTVGFIGLGNMGRPMAQNLISDGFKVMLHTNEDSVSTYRTLLEKADKSLVTVAVTPTDVATHSDIIFSCVSDGDSLREVVYSTTTGVLLKMRIGKAFVNFSTVDLLLSSQIASSVESKGGRYLEAMICGDIHEAQQGSLLFLCSGHREVFEDCEVFFQALGSRALFLGEIGNAVRLKLALQALYGTISAGVAEAYTLADHLGLSLQDFSDVIRMTNLNSPLIGDLGRQICERKFIPPQFRLAHMQNDLQACMGLSHLLELSLPLTAAANEVFKRAKMQGEGQNDVAAVYRSVAEQFD